MVSYLQTLSQLRAFLHKHLSSLIFAGWVLLFVQIGSHELKNISDKVIASVGLSKPSASVGQVDMDVHSNIDSRQAKSASPSSMESRRSPTGNLSLEQSRFSRELLAIDNEFPLSISASGTGANSKLERITVRGKSMLLTDKNRPRVNQDFAHVFSPLIARIRGQSKSIQLTLVRGSQISDTWIQPIEKFMQRFYGMNVSVVDAENPASFELIMEISQ